MKGVPAARQTNPDVKGQGAHITAPSCSSPSQQHRLALLDVLQKILQAESILDAQEARLI